MPRLSMRKSLMMVSLNLKLVGRFFEINQSGMHTMRTLMDLTKESILRQKLLTCHLTASADPVTDLPRPTGCKKAKEELNRKGKGKVSSSIMDEIDKLIEGQQKSKEDRMEILDRHQQIAADKKESARLTHRAAQENKEAKLLEKEGKKHDKESKLLETYKALSDD
jgi:hypothetical protein